MFVKLFIRAMERPEKPPLPHTSGIPGWWSEFLSSPSLGTLSETMMDCQIGIFEPSFLSTLPLLAGSFLLQREKMTYNHTPWDTVSAWFFIPQGPPSVQVLSGSLIMVHLRLSLVWTGFRTKLRSRTFFILSPKNNLSQFTIMHRKTQENIHFFKKVKKI